MAAPLRAQESRLDFRAESYRLDSGRHENAGDETVVAFTARIQAPGTPWMRVIFSDYDLGRASYITLTSALDGDWQRHDAETLREWQNGSGVFRGDEVVLELHVAPGDKDVFIAVDRVLIADLPGEEVPAQGGVADLCFGDDDRQASSDPAVGRLFFGGCTAWLVGNGAVLAAGHCVDGDPDKAAVNCSANPGTPCCLAACCGNECCTSQLPDGQPDAIFLNAVVEFNVPASLSNGVPVPASLNDQYPVNFNSGGYLGYQSTGCDPNSSNEAIANNGVGIDWAVFSVGRNANTGLTPHVAYGAFWRLAALIPLDDRPACVTGYGIDNTSPGTGDSRCLAAGTAVHDQACTNPGPNCVSSSQCGGNLCCPAVGSNNAQSVTQQYACGPYQDFTSDGDRHWHTYKADTMPATSGSPVIIGVADNTRVYAIGINTHSGCSGDGNTGTAFTQPVLNQWLNNFIQPAPVYVDSGWGPCIGPCDGTIFEPLPNVAQGVGAVADGGTVVIVRGSYPHSQGNAFTAGADGKAMTLLAPVGPVTIGN